MTLRVVFRPAAKREFDDAADRYDEQRPGLGEEFIVEIDQAVEKAAAAPERYPIVFGDVRRTVARRFPFSVYFSAYFGERDRSFRSIVTVRHGTS